jgi:hypothetical protein
LIADDDSGGNMNAAITNYELPQEGEYTLIIGHAAGMQDTPGDIRISVELAALDIAEDTSGD